MGKHSGNRSVRNRIRKRRQRRAIISLILLVVLVIAGTFMWKRSGTNLSNNQARSATSTVKKSSTSQSTTKETDNSSQKTSKINWVKQEQPVKFPILMYHAIHNMDPSEAANAGLIVSPETFESHLKALKDAGYYTLTPEEAYKVLTENVLPKNKKVVWLTFDDSLKDFYTNAFPLLQKYQMRATNNVITSFVDETGREDMLTLDQIKEMKEKGMSFEDHTVNHPDLSLSSAETQTTELQDSKQYLDSNLSQNTTTVAYPSGRYSETTIQIAESLGYKMGLTTNNGLASLNDGLLTLNRVRVNPTTTAQDLLNEIATN
ncbi:Poly-beta-1,6-N-acetyl-D-glucosamine N-deacetylase precursor [Streptococcus constellatus]|uniref:Poly-beta-1,6-N-acetyl-D-glucosamine N-deacetylase n=1 Tax=Streptococcus constellatus TaxID=76860 RepID=A0A564SN91_STRCV|nr:polysaccharide deacetylase family protein [Streptococcus constellatus]VUW96615.1 Poly-beta-1,6-N-acetyl-D-glucosamine N-deacetylase precursor [Streptococcus constellatus]VUX06434.1 Poly-beta-1,6-N-acetyl-D-glucosamine N-deacetylase precursor [Streptococcus gordonii]